MERYVNATGLTQAWNVFAPDPKDETGYLVARIDYADGSSLTWQPPRGGALFGEYETYHWAAESSRLRQDGARSQWVPFATWLVKTQDHGDRLPARVELLRRSLATRPPGSNLPPAPWQECVFFTLDLPSPSR